MIFENEWRKCSSTTGGPSGGRGAREDISAGEAPDGQ